MKRVLSLLIIMTLVLAYPFRAVPEEMSSSHDFIFLMDMSYHMRGEKFEIMKENVKEAIGLIFASAPDARIALVGYSVIAYKISDFKGVSGINHLIDSIDQMETLYDACMTDALKLAENMMNAKDTKDKTCIVFSGGMPTDAEAGIRRAADALKKTADVYAVGLMQSLSDNRKEALKTLLSGIASFEDGIFLTEKREEVRCAAYEILSRTVFDGAKIEVRCEETCEIAVSYFNVTIDKNNPHADFGRLIVLEDGSKIVRLFEEHDYDVEITCLSDTKISFSIAFADEKGEFTDERKVSYIPVRYGTRILANTDKAAFTRVSVDLNGDYMQDFGYSVAPGTGIEAKEPIRMNLSDYETGNRLSRHQVSAHASSTLPKSRYGDYSAYSAVDGDSYSTWVEGVQGNGRGETLTISFDETEVIGFVIQAGMFRSRESYMRNTRVKEMKVLVQGEAAYHVVLEDVMKDQVILFERPVTTSFVTIELVDFYTTGIKGEDTCITDIWILTP